MAKQVSDNMYKYLKLNRKEAADLVTLLIGLLADVPIKNNHAGEIPIINVHENESSHKLCISVEDAKPPVPPEKKEMSDDDFEKMLWDFKKSQEHRPQAQPN
jgi:hypothetical protein